MLSFCCQLEHQQVLARAASQPSKEPRYTTYPDETGRLNPSPQKIAKPHNYPHEFRRNSNRLFGESDDLPALEESKF